MLLLGLGISGGWWRHAVRQEAASQRTEFEFAADMAAGNIRNRFNVYAVVMRGVKGLFEGGDSISFDEFQAYVQALRLDQAHGVQAIGMVELVPNATKGQHLTDMRQHYAPNYQITPQGMRERYAPIVRIEQMAGDNLKAIGFDTLTVPAARAAMDAARDTDDLRMSAKVPLTQDAGKPALPAFVMYLPIYRQAARHETPAERRAGIVGWVNVPFHLHTLMQGLRGEFDPDLDVRIHDGSPPTGKTLIYRSDGLPLEAEGATPDSLQTSRQLLIGGRQWTLVMGTTPALAARLSFGSPSTRGALGGVALTLALSLLTWLLARGRQHAQASERKTSEDRIQFLSNFDPLTQLPNRGLLRDRAQLVLTAAKREQSPAALMFIDLVRFKIINDSLGHSVGDQLLKELSQRLLGHLRQDDTLCHQGGDEFMLLLPNTDVEGAAHTARNLLDVVAKPLTIAGHRLVVTASIGIAEYPQDGDDFEQMAQSADAALHRAKQSGRNTFQFFTRLMQEQAKSILKTEGELRRALEQQEFFLYYQPQVDAKTSEIVGVEALIRWQNPQNGLVAPASFIPIAEESDLIIEIGTWVLNTAVQQVAAWQAQGLGVVPVAVNLSAVQFRQDTLYQAVAQALRASKLDPALLELEMTEGIAMENSERTLKLLDRLHALGVGLSIDDFGTGYSSLSYLKRFKVDKLKIDSSFVHDLGRNPEDGAIVTAIITMAKGLGFKTVAEGVQTLEQLQFLRENQCDQIQGYLFSRPVSAQAFAQLLRQGGHLPDNGLAPSEPI